MDGETPDRGVGDPAILNAVGAGNCAATKRVDRVKVDRVKARINDRKPVLMQRANRFGVLRKLPAQRLNAGVIALNQRHIRQVSLSSGHTAS